ERMRMPGPDGRIGHAELSLGNSVIMLADENPDMDARGPRSTGGTPVLLYAYVDDVDAASERATAAGATTRREIANRFYGGRSGQFEDPSGHAWDIATHVEDVPPDEMSRRAAEVMGAAQT